MVPEYTAPALAIFIGIRGPVKVKVEKVHADERVDVVVTAKTYGYPLGYRWTESGRHVVPRDRYKTRGFDGWTKLPYKWVTTRANSVKRKPNGGKVARYLDKRQDRLFDRLWKSTIASSRFQALLDKSGLHAQDVMLVFFLLVGNDAEHLAREFSSALKSKPAMRKFYIDDRALKSFRPILWSAGVKATSAQSVRTINKLKKAAAR